MFLEELILVWCMVFAFWLWLKPRRSSPPVFPGALPVIGHAHLLLGDPLYLWRIEREIYYFCLENGGIIEVRLGPVPVYVITDLDDSLLIANTCLDKPYLYNFGKDLYNRGLITASALTWKPDRKILNPAFNQQILNTFVEEYSTQARILVSELSCEVGKEPFDVKPYLVKNILRAVYKTTLGVKLNDHEQELTVRNYAHATEEYFALIEDRFQKFWLHLPFVYNMSSMKKKQDALTKTLKKITKAVIIKRKSELKSQIYSKSLKEPIAANFESLLDVMLDVAIKEDAFTDDEIREHLDTIIAAAYDSTTKAMTFVLLLVGSYPDVQARIFKELQEVFDDKDRDLNRHDLPKLVYLEAVIKESMRLFPPVPRVAKCGQSSLKLKHYTIPAGSTYAISVYGINRHPIWGADADQFRPERWLDPATLPDDHNAFASFSIGRRNCIGKKHAMMSMKTIMAYVLRRYRVTGDISNVQTVCDLILKPVSGHHITLELRT